MTGGSVPTAVKTYVTEYTAQQKNQIVDAVPNVVIETLKISTLTNLLSSLPRFQAAARKRRERSLMVFQTWLEPR